MPNEVQHPSIVLGLEAREPWESWVGSYAPPEMRIKRGAKVVKRDGVKWITYPDTIGGVDVVIEMPETAPTKSCHEGRHDDCPHRLGGPHEGGHMLKGGLATYFIWRCHCPCHRDPQRAGRLF